MKKVVVVLMAFLFVSPNVIVANPASQRAAATLTNRVMRMLEPQIADIAGKAPVPSDAKDEMTRQLTESARQIVNREIQAATGGRLPRPAAIVNNVVGELNNISQDIALGIIDGSLAGGGNSGSAVIMSSARQATTPPLELRPFLAVYVFGHNDPTVNNFLSIDITHALVRSEHYREAPRYEEFLTTVENRQHTESRVIELAREYDIQQIGILSMRSILGTYVIRAKIINTETGEAIAETQLDNSLASLADIRVASEELVAALILEVVRNTPPPTVVLEPTSTPEVSVDLEIVVVELDTQKIEEDDEVEEVSVELEIVVIDPRNEQVFRAIVMPDGKTWMTENLNFEIGNSWCYNNDESNCNTHGRLYDWESAMMACPAGWRLPSNAEWTNLINAIGGQRRGGTKLKSSNGWRTHSRTPMGTDEFGFSALPGGHRNRDGSFRDFGSNGYWWTSTEDDMDFARRWRMNYNNENASSNRGNKANRYSIRCVSD